MSGIERTTSVEGILEQVTWTVGWNELVFVSGVHSIGPDTRQPAIDANLPTRTIVKVTGLNPDDSIKTEIIAAQTEPQ